MTERRQVVLGWLAVGVSTALGCFWAFWGILETFHEGWYSSSLLHNLALTVAQYLLPMLLLLAPALVGVRWPKLGGGLHVAEALGAAWFFRDAALGVLVPFIVGPLLLLGAAYALGRPRPRRWANAILIGLPLATLVVCGMEPALRVAGRVDDGDRGSRRVAGNGVDLVWAPAGPGWPNHGICWDEARRRCAHLTADGLTLAQSPQGIWRLPTVEEAVQSQCRHGRNCGGTWDPNQLRATYRILPDKESPLWDSQSQVIYWWTATEVDEDTAYIVVYNGQVWPRPKRAHWGYLGFRAVKSPDGS
jgi:hypothetical protein